MVAQYKIVDILKNWNFYKKKKDFIFFTLLANLFILMAWQPIKVDFMVRD